MSPNEIEAKASSVAAYLRSENAVRESMTEVGNYKSVYEICDAVGIYMGDWTKIKTHMLHRGQSICYKPGAGHYLGFKGEEISNVVYKQKIARGWVKHLRATKEAIRAASPEAREWIKRRFVDFKIDEQGDESLYV